MDEDDDDDDDDEVDDEDDDDKGDDEEGSGRSPGLDTKHLLLFALEEGKARNDIRNKFCDV